MAVTCPHDPRLNKDYRPRTIYPCPVCGKDVRAGERHVPEGGTVDDPPGSPLREVIIPSPHTVGKPPTVELHPITFTKINTFRPVMLKPLTKEQLELIHKHFAVRIEKERLARKLPTSSPCGRRRPSPMSLCPHDPSGVFGPIGMYHCPECGEMVVAGLPHPDYDTPWTDEDYAVASGQACWINNHSAWCQSGDVLDYIDF